MDKRDSAWGNFSKFKKKQGIADEIVATAVYGVGELHDSYGIEVIADSSIQ